MGGYYFHHIQFMCMYINTPREHTLSMNLVWPLGFQCTICGDAFPKSLSSLLALLLRTPPTSTYSLNFFSCKQQKLTLANLKTRKTWKNTSVAHHSRAWSEDSGPYLGRGQTLFRAPSPWVTSRCHQPWCHPPWFKSQRERFWSASTWVTSTI